MGRFESLNNRFILETYKTDGSLRSEVNSGFAMIAQKNTLIGLKLLVDTRIVLEGFSTTYFAGSIAYIKEEYLHTQPWAKKKYKSDSVDEEFIIVNKDMVEFVKEADPIKPAATSVHG